MIFPCPFKVILEDCQRRECHCIVLSPQTERGKGLDEAETSREERGPLETQQLQRGPSVPNKEKHSERCTGHLHRHMHNRMGNFRQHGGGHASGRNGQGGRTDWDGILLANSYSLF